MKGANQQCVNVMLFILLLSFFIVFDAEFLNNTVVKPLYQYSLLLLIEFFYINSSNNKFCC